MDQAPQWRKNAKNGVKCSLYTDVILFFFSFFTRTSASSRAKRARRARKKNKELFFIFFFPHHYPLALAVNKSPAVYITALAHLRPTLRPPWLVPLLFARPTKPLCYETTSPNSLTEKAWKIGKPPRQLSGALGWPTERLRELKRLQKFYTDDVHQSPPSD